MEKRQFSSVQNLDRISYLPEQIQSHILSFLPFKDATRIRVLSRQWRSICSSLSYLDFDELHSHSPKDLKEIIDHTLILHSRSNIKRFKLDVEIDGEDVCSHHLNRWISFAIQHNVTELDITLQNGYLEKLPCCLFTGNTLTVLLLSGFHLKLPPVIQFPVLKQLEFHSVTFSDEYLTNKLFSDSSCPGLKTLIISYCFLDKFTNICVSVTSLRSLEILNDNSRLKLKVSSPKLYKLIFAGGRLPDISQETLSSLSFASFENFSKLSRSDVIENLAGKILLGLVNVHELRLLGNYVEFLSSVQDMILSLPCSYCGLKRLNILMPPNLLQVVPFLLRSYPNLQILYFSFYEDEPPSNMLDAKVYWQSNKLYTGDILKQLKEVEIQDFQGSQSELDLVQLILENANILEEMKIDCMSSKHVTDNRNQISGKLLAFTRASPRAKVLFF